MHELILEDEQFHKAVLERIGYERKNAEWAVTEELERVIDGLEGSGDPYFRARAEDIRDMVQNLIAGLTESSKTPLEGEVWLEQSHVVVTSNLFVSEVMRAQGARIQGFVTESSALTSHGAILLKSYNIPAIGHAEGVYRHAGHGDPVIVDADHGMVIVRPGKNTRQEYEKYRRRLIRRPGGSRYVPRAPETKDGTPVHLLANIDNDGQLIYVFSNRLEGIGLFRTEFLVLEKGDMPGEEEQYEAYKRVLDRMGGKRVVFRTFDLGGDKAAGRFERCAGRNPALGMRGIRRHLLQRQEELRIQLRALLRAGEGRRVDILLPMVTMAGEIKQVREQLDLVRGELTASGESVAPRVRLGAMIEVPAAAFAVQEILSEVDFVSLGTNDLIQYFMAADRDNEAVMSYYGNLYSRPFRSLLHLIMERAAAMGRAEDVAMCGEIAADSACVPVLLRMGYRSLSIAPVHASLVRQAIASTDLRLSAEPSP
jgi:phosphotransferase system enzyme I (PtsI)